MRDGGQFPSDTEEIGEEIGGEETAFGGYPPPNMEPTEDRGLPAESDLDPSDASIAEDFPILASDTRPMEALPPEDELVDASELGPPEEADAEWRRRVPHIAGYEYYRLLGSGCVGTVYEARHVGKQHLVAIKVIEASELANPIDVDHFRRSAAAVTRLQHPHLVQLYEAGMAEGFPFMVLELVTGGSLAQRLQGTPQPVRESAAFVLTLAEAVQHAHDHGVYHHDLSPANILLAGERGARPAPPPPRSCLVSPRLSTSASPESSISGPSRLVTVDC